MLRPYNGPGGEPVGFYIAPQFSLLFFLAIYDPLRVANEISGKELFTYKIISDNGGLVTAFNGMNVLSSASISEVDYLPTVILCTGYQPEGHRTKPVLSWLRKLARRGTQFGAIDTGCDLLATAGLLDGYKVTMHWQVFQSFQEQFPDIQVTKNLFEIDRDRFTCAGGTAGFEMMLYLIGQRHGSDLAAAIAEQFIHDHRRYHSASQRFPYSLRLGIHNPTLLNTIEIMEQNIEEPLDIKQLSRRAGVSKRQLERLFHSYLRSTPMGYYLNLRLRSARDLLQQTPMSVTDVAIACGFTSPAYFSRAYRKCFGWSPRNDRKMGAFRLL